MNVHREDTIIYIYYTQSTASGIQFDWRLQVTSRKAHKSNRGSTESQGNHGSVSVYSIQLPFKCYSFLDPTMTRDRHYMVTLLRDNGRQVPNIFPLLQAII